MSKAPKSVICDYLRLFRAHTAPATIILVMMGFLVGGGELFSWYSLFLVLYITLVHWISFGHNSLMDTATGWDLRDIYKKHHPLVDGRIKMSSAHNVIHWSVIILTLLAFMFIWLSPGSKFFAAFSFLLFVACGHAYNCGLNKNSIFSWIPPTLAQLGIFAFGFFLASSSVDALILLIFGYVAVSTVFIYGWENEVKDIMTGEKTILQNLGVKCDGKMFIPSLWGKIWGYGVKCFALILAFAVFLFYCRSIINAIIFAILGASAVYFCVQLVKKRRWDHNKTLRNCALEEISGIYLMSCILASLVGYLEVVALLAFGIVYYISFNFICWRTILRPQV